MTCLLASSGGPAEKLNIPPGPGFPTEVWYLLIAVGVIVVGFIIWAVFLRRPPEEFSGWGPSHSKYQPPAPAGEGSETHRRRRRRRRREHRPRNPTLAETGGLPPIRQDDASARPDA